MMDQLQIKIRRERRLKLAAFLVTIGLSIVAIFVVDNLLVSFVLAVVITYLLAPIVNLLESSRMPRQLAILIPFIGATALIVLAIFMIAPLLSMQLFRLESQLPQYQHDLINLLARTESRFKGFFNVYNINMSMTINAWIVDRTTLLSAFLPGVISRSLTVVMLAPFFAFFMLQDGRSISRSLLSMVPNNLFELALNLHHQINEQLGGFIRARFLEAAIVGIVVWVGLLAVGFPYATLLALFAALTNLIPYLGPIVGAVPAVIIALVSEDARIAGSMSLNLVLVTSIYFIAQLIDVVFIIPFVVAKIVNLHPVTVIIVIIIGAQLMGILGMMISIPIASALKLTVTAVYDHLMEFRA